MGGAADFKVGYKTGFASGATEKNVPPLFQKRGYKQANISRGLLNILKKICCMVVALINIGRPRPRPMVL